MDRVPNIERIGDYRTNAIMTLEGALRQARLKLRPAANSMTLAQTPPRFKLDVMLEQTGRRQKLAALATLNLGVIEALTSEVTEPNEAKWQHAELSGHEAPFAARASHSLPAAG